MYRLGIDIGGTFTDVALINILTGELYVSKVLTTGENPDRGAIQGALNVIKEANISLSEVDTFVHATTVVTNLLIERKGAKTALLVTKGAKDVLEIGREKRYDMYDLFLEMPTPIVPRYLRWEINERILADGHVYVPLNDKEVNTIANKLTENNIESLAVCFLNSYVNPTHEQEAALLLGNQVKGVGLTISSDILPEIREYERMSTTVINAYAQPKMLRYLTNLKDVFYEHAFDGEILIVLSDGGVVPSETAASYPVRAIESGPAVGAGAAARCSRELKMKKVISFDMGGTTAKICLIKNGTASVGREFEVDRIYRFKKGSGLPIKTPTLDMIEIGAGGGSIACIDSMGFLTVGPRSAGAEPGPVCYGRGGSFPTVTDADLIVGYLNPNYFLGGKINLSIADAESVIQHYIAEPLGFNVYEAAKAIHEVVNENMANAARNYCVEKGEDPSQYSLICFGGAGPVHGWGVAERLGIKQLIFPFGAGVNSAIGCLTAPLLFELTRSCISTIGQLDFKNVKCIIEEMRKNGMELLTKVGERDITFVMLCDGKYVGQGHEIRFPISPDVLEQENRVALRQAFEKEYRKRFGRLNNGLDIELVNWHVRVSGPEPNFIIADQSNVKSASESIIKGKRKIYISREKGFELWPVIDRYLLHEGDQVDGPCIIEEREATIVVGSSGKGKVDKEGNIIVQRE